MVLVASNRMGNSHSFKINFDTFRQDDFLCCAFESLTHFHNAELEQFLVAFVQFFLKLKGKTLIDLTVLYMDVINICIFIVAGDRKDVNIRNGVTNHLTFCRKIL